MASKREGDLEDNAFPREIIDDVHRAKCSAGDKSVMHEVDRPSLIRTSDRRNDIAANIAHLALLARPHLQRAFTIGSQQTMLSNAHPLTPQQDLQSAPTEARSLGRQLSKARRERLIDPRFEAIVHIATRTIHQTAGLALRKAFVLQCPHRVFSLRGPQPFFETRLFMASISRACRAIIRCICAFSASSCLSRTRSLVSRPEYLSFQSRIVFA